MKKGIFKILLISHILLLIVGCSEDNNSDKIIDNIEQTHWKGTFQNADGVYDITIVFSSVKNGYYILDRDKEQDSFSYNKDGKIIHISCFDIGFLNGDWWIYKLTEDEFILKQNPYEENISCMLNLKRIY
ncbi:hypothetical protein FACS1894169_15270 [Bacteroidia bacterium]|nr:hypothetical protein FACS1894169_15270 [Bacteroidia bacterium]